jgi:hypothetical protein
VVDSNNKFHDVEHDLREQLALRSAPPGFAKKVLARIDESQHAAPFRMPAWRWMAAAAVLTATAVLAGGQWEYHREQQIAGQRARAQVMLALRIAGSTLQQVQQKVQRTGRDTQ